MYKNGRRKSSKWPPFKIATIIRIFKHLIIIVLISFDLKAILNSISGVKYHFAVRFQLGLVYNKVKVKQILFNSLNYTSLSSLFH